MDLYLFYTRFMTFLGVLACIGLILANILVIVRVAPGSNSVELVMQVIIRIYVILLTFLAFWALFDSKFLFTHMRVLSDWPGLGMLMLLCARDLFTRISLFAHTRTHTADCAQHWHHDARDVL